MIFNSFYITIIITNNVIDIVILLIRCGLFDVLYLQALRDRCRKHAMKWRKALFEWTHVKSVFLYSFLQFIYFNISLVTNNGYDSAVKFFFFERAVKLLELRNDFSSILWKRESIKKVLKQYCLFFFYICKFFFAIYKYWELEKYYEDIVNKNECTHVEQFISIES